MYSYTIEDRVAKVTEILRHNYYLHAAVDESEASMDLMTDLMHFMAAHNLDPQTQYERADGHFDVERMAENMSVYSPYKDDIDS